MENIVSGSVSLQLIDEDEIDESLEMLMEDPLFEQDLINSFNDKMYIISKNAPNPIWTLCSITMQMVRLLPNSEVIPVDELSFHWVGDDNLIECLAGTNLIKIPKKYVQRGEWH